ncbi:hypothetical protein [Dactylosporangium matsuzakiense]|uniref:Uncharacterized protein n=1 Tax=Dactylosporangium matsuzakiense TaxID=53360 RepID=A0A9W6KHQ3_9ACTN|nr:hypothetical protein [Dactylosporangium matsuzakiense]UWZ41628.1 hypothetical protein Dmats_28725 [Dactylosporangium matsuzakiense]GLL02297.1 hypothetical protein GCM10017581_040390 [Dactylosporangium matsuzakiense]
MRDWIGLGLSLAGLGIMAVALVLWVRSRAWRPARQSGVAWRRSSVATFGALVLLEAGLLTRPHAWPLTLLYLAVTAIAAAGLLMWYLDRRRLR